MADYLALTDVALPRSLFGEDSGHSIRLITNEERLYIEDFFFASGRKIVVDALRTVVVIPENRMVRATLEEFAVLIEFALSLIATTGFASVGTVASLNPEHCLNALTRPQSDFPAPKFPAKLTGNAASGWMRQFFVARGNTKDRLHITADRFARFCKAGSTADGLVDLCISLESLIESEVEISFRFSVCLAKMSGEPNAEELSRILTDLYSLRSKVVHGADSTKAHSKLGPHIPKLRLTARIILTRYIFHLAEHSKEEWKRQLKSSLFS